MNTSPLLRTLLTSLTGLALASAAMAQGSGAGTVNTAPSSVPNATSPYQAEPAAGNGPGTSTGTSGAGSNSPTPATGSMGAGGNPAADPYGAGAMDQGNSGSNSATTPGSSNSDTGAGNMGAGGTPSDYSATGDAGAASSANRRMRADRN